MDKRRIWRTVACAIWTLIALITPARAAEDADAASTVTVKRYKDAGKIPYSDFRAAFDVFDKNAARIPGATLRFSLVPFTSIEKAKDISIRLIADHDVRYLPLDADAAFTVPRLPPGHDDDWMLVIEAHVEKMSKDERHFNFIVMSPGTDFDHRRLGDMRIACALSVAVAKARLSLFQRFLAGNRPDPCKAKVVAPALHPVEKIRFTSEGRVAEFANPFYGRGETFFYGLPLDEPSWPDDTRVDLVYGNGAPPPPAQAPAPAAPAMTVREGISYSIVRAAYDSFDKHAHHAPQAELVFRLPGTVTAERLNKSSVRLVKREETRVLPIAPDGTFQVPRLAQGADREWQLVVDDGTGHALPPVARIKSPLMSATRRPMGEWRLECAVGAATRKAGLPSLAQFAMGTIQHPCELALLHLHFTAGREVAAIRLSAAGRIAEIANERTDKHVFEVPVYDASWPDETDVELVMAPGPTAPIPDTAPPAPANPPPR